MAACAVSAAAVLSGCSQGGGATSDPNTSAGAANGECSNLQQLARWDLDRRVGQVLMGAIYADGGETAIRAAVKQIAKGQVGGINLLGIESVMRPYADRIRAWNRIATDLPLDKLEAMILPASLSDLPALGAAIIKGGVQGRIVVDVNATGTAS